jgi:hypothetical protein
MAPKKSVRSSGSVRPRSAVAKVAAHTKPVALTLKLDSKMYVRLRTFGATQRRTNQDILQEAVQQYLDRIGA